MKRIIVVAAIAVLCITLGGCFPPTIPIDDPDDPVTPVLTIPVAAFSFYPPEYPVQTGSEILFDGSASYDPDGEIMWGRWNFDDKPDPVISEGEWVMMGKEIKNGEEVWTAYSLEREKSHSYLTVGDYTVMLTVWDYDGNQSSTTRTVRVK